MRGFVGRCLAVLAALTACSPVVAAYPEKPIRLIVPFTPAGATDLLARLTGEQLGSRLGQSVVIENRPGAGANLGAELVSRAPPDGYTILMGPASVYAISATLYPRLNYDVVRDLAPVSLIANVPHVLLVNRELSIQSLAELLAQVKARPGAWNIASQGSGTVSHLEAELLKSMAGLDLLHVPYRGSAPAILDLIGGRVQLMFDSIASALPHVRGGKVRPIAVASRTRSLLLPDVPTMEEAGLKGYSAHSWLGLFVPAGTPSEVVDRLQRAIAVSMNQAAVREKFIAAGFEPQASSAAEFAALVREEIEKWRPIVKVSGATPD